MCRSQGNVNTREFRRHDTQFSSGKEKLERTVSLRCEIQGVDPATWSRDDGKGERLKGKSWCRFKIGHPREV